MRPSVLWLAAVVATQWPLYVLLDGQGKVGIGY